jgi:hypothetical protein
MELRNWYVPHDILSGRSLGSDNNYVTKGAASDFTQHYCWDIRLIPQHPSYKISKFASLSPSNFLLHSSSNLTSMKVQNGRKLLQKRGKGKGFMTRKILMVFSEASIVATRRMLQLETIISIKRAPDNRK